MRKLLLALAALLAFSLGEPRAQISPVGPPNQILCNNAAISTVVTATTTAVLNGIAGQRIFICGWHVTSNQAASTTFQLIQGTQGGPCGTPTNITPAFNVTSTAPSADHVDFAQFQLGIGNQLCVITTGTTIGMAILVWYDQF